ncbi:hypothetical protein EB151_04305 [archaeon]|nr:hypothetical protein [archaeon]
MIRNICILGGGTAGFMTAAVLSQYAKNLKVDLNIKCVYSSKIGIIGVGESTQLAINGIFQFLRLSDKEWMPKCNATYKTNVRFENWSDTPYYYPFGDMTGEDVSQFLILKDLFPDEVDKTQFARFVRQSSRFAELNRLTDEGWEFNDLTSYHFDTHKLSKFLYDIGTKNGVEYVDDIYLDSTLNSRGDIDYIICEETGNHYADLFVDCTGFKSLLLGEKLKVPYKSYSDTLINNRVINAKIPYTDKNEQLKTYTNNVAMKNGWCWEIPLWDGISVGYVHSTKFATEDEIYSEFFDRYSVEPNSTIYFKTGRYENAWVKNVVGVGLSWGFIEPLEATGLASIVNNIFRLLETLSTSLSINSFDKEAYNYACNSELDGLKTFIDMHYAAVHRDDSEYWDYVTNQIQYPWNQRNCGRSIELIMGDRNFSNKNINGGLPFILVGSGYGPNSPAFINALADKNYYKKIKDDWITYDNNTTERFLNLPTTYEFTKNKIYE